MPLTFKPVKCDPKLKELGIHSDEYINDYESISRDLLAYKSSGTKEGESEYLKIVKHLSAEDFFFFCYFVLDLPINHPFLVARANDVQRRNHLTLDLWFREGWKSTLLTFALPIQEIIQNPENRICIFSHTRAMAKSHMRKIKLELESNQVLWKAFDNIFYENPKSRSPKWSEDDGLYVKRKRNYGEASFEAWGLIEKMPAGKHFTIRVYDDIVTETAVNTAGQLEKVESQFGLSENLGTKGGRKRIIGTRYSHKDLYGKLISKRWETRIHPAEVDDSGEAMLMGTPVYLSREELNAKYEDMGEYIYGAQMLQNPTAASAQKFRLHWLKKWTIRTVKPYMNVYILADPARVVKKETDPTVFIVLGTDHNRNYWVLDIVRKKMELGERWTTLRDLVLSWRPLGVGYQAHNAEADLNYFDMQMQAEGEFFGIVALKSFRAKSGDYSRISSLMPLFERGRIIIPESLPVTEKDGQFRDIIVEFVNEEYEDYPFGEHDDILDSLADINDPEMGIFFPTQKQGAEHERRKSLDDPLNLNNYYDDEADSWMGY